jgi:predicted dehydrogenase
MEHLNRRGFIGSGIAASASGALAQPKPLKLGLIGCGWWGGVDSKAALAAGGVEFVAVCDVDTKNLEETVAALEKQQGSRPRTYRHYTDLLAAGGLDGVIIATPPQWHALPFIAACERKLPVYQEKPLAYDILEGSAMVKAWRQAGNTVQVGFQRRQSEAFRQVKEYIQSGAPGRIVQVDVNIHYTAGMLDSRPQEPPPGLDWDLWCGPAPKIAYSPNVGQRTWRLEQTTGNGHLVDWGIHLIDALRQILNESTPTSVTAVGGLYELKGQITTPDTLTASFEFARCPVVWRHRIWGAAELNPDFSNGITLFGEKETIFATDNRWIVVPRAKDTPRKVVDIQPPTDLSGLHMKEWLAAVRSGGKPSCTPADAFLSTAAVQLAMISYRSGATIQWDLASERITNNAAANGMLMRPYRAPYKHPYSG